MARILVVSRNPAMAMSLAATDHEVLEVRPADFGAWIIDEDVADALVLDLENPRLSVAAVTNLRAHAKLAPVLLVSNDHPGWDDPKMGRLPGAVVLPLPVSKAAMLSALEDLLSPEWDGRQAVPPQHAEVTEALHELAETHGVLLSEDDRLDEMLAAALGTPTENRATAQVDVDLPAPEAASVATFAPGTGRRHGRGSHRKTEVPRDVAPVSSDVAAEAHPTAGSASGDTRTLPPLPRTQRTTRLPVAASSTTSRSEIEALRPSTGPVVPERRHQDDSGAIPEAPEAQRPSRDDGVELVRRLRRVVDSLFGVRETARRHHRGRRRPDPRRRGSSHGARRRRRMARSGRHRVAPVGAPLRARHAVLGGPARWPRRTRASSSRTAT